MKRLEILLLAILGGFTAVFLFLTKDYNPTAALFPRGIAIASIVFLAAVIWGSFRDARGKNSVSDTELLVKQVSDTEFFPRASLKLYALQVAYIVLMYLLGFIAATFLFLLIAPIQLHYRRWGVVALHGVVVTLVLAGSFLWLFNVQLPAGVVWNLW